MRYLSLFSGMEAATIAWRPLGWECAGVSEIDPAACAVLRHRLPGVPNLGSVTEITDADIAALGPIDVVIGGSPCQDLSVAGKRAGLEGERSGLFHEQLRIFNAARTLCGARWLIWENVPGAFSSNKGRDFAVVVGAMAGCELPVPADGWGSEGVALGDSGLVEWAVLNSEWFGVAQRRRRVFAVLDTGDWANRPPVLLEPESLRGDSAPRREAGEGAAGRAAASVAFRGRDGGAAAEVGDDCAFTLRASTGGGDKPHALTWPAEVAHTLRGEGFDASEDGTGRGTPLVPVPFDTTQITSAANYSNPKAGDPCHPLAAGAHPPAIAFSCKDHGADAGELSPTLRAMGHGASHANAGGQVAVALALRGRDGGATAEVGDDCAFTLRASGGGGDKPHVMAGMSVRRLTPREAERLQAAPDDWTLVPNDRGKPMADGPRYRMCGNSFTATVIRWIGRRIEAVVAYSEQRREAA